MCRCHATHTCPAFYSSSPQSGLAASKCDIRWTEAFPRRKPGRPACRPSARRSRSMPGRSGRRDSGAAKANGPARVSRPFVQPSLRSMLRIKDRNKALTDWLRTQRRDIAEYRRIQPDLARLANYFHDRNCTRTISNVKLRVDERVQFYLLHRHKPGASTWIHRFSGPVIYVRNGLFRLPTKALWRSAHALLRRPLESRVRKSVGMVR
jgi:hypothetical protein